ncbi:hypothetical protein GCM10009001_16500 [Virgibacillus siamensis]|uniref:DUF2953 domain-containing protein n=1 Tax=Virgibacillus siamensis TaxID=480071 RepID=A0ABP3R502_9BACI
MWIVGIILLICIIVLCSNALITCQAVFQKDCQKVVVSVQFYRIKIFSRTVHLSEQETVEMSVEQSVELFQSTGTNLINSVKAYHDAATILLKQLTFREYYWKTEFGTGKADATGLASGGIWAIKGYLTGYVSNKSTFKNKPSISVTPYFNRICFRSELECIVSIRIGQAMYALLKVIRKVPFKKEAVI